MKNNLNMRILILMILIISSSCSDKPKTKKTSYNIVTKVSEKDTQEYIIKCDTIPAVYLDTETGNVSIQDEIVCDTILIQQ